MLNKKAQYFPVELLLIIIVMSLILINLEYTNQSYLSSLITNSYNKFYTKEMMKTTLNYKYNNISLSTLISSYLCSGDKNIKDILDDLVPKILNNITRDNYHYIFFNYPNLLIKYTSYDGKICLSNVNLISVDLNLSCMETKINLAIWEKGKEVGDC